MEKDGGVKVPVTRLRRRLSVEQSDDQRSSPAPSTPTKKRSTLAIKPQLELIEEHAVTDSPKWATRKSISTDISATAEKPVTPARRSTRVKSNTSLVSEAEEKLITPSRRSTRIKSNTSIVSEASQSAESPRAKRVVTRRNSNIGSDTEIPVTPARTRRTNQASLTSADRDSSKTPIVNDIAITPGRIRQTRKRTSSIDTPAKAIYADQPAPLITKVIAEEHSIIENDNIDNRDDSPTTRKSLRLMAKKGRSVSRKSEDIIENVSQENIIAEDTNTLYQGTKISSEATPHNEISMNSANLINDLVKKAKKTFQKNKSMSEIEGTKTKRHRTKSWTTLCASPSSPTGSNFYGDNESAKKKIEQFGSLFKFSDTGSGDGNNQIIVDKQSDLTVNPTKKSMKNKDKSFSASIPGNESLADTKDADKSVKSNKVNILDVLPLEKTLDLLFEQHPSEVKTVVFLEDSDSNTGSLGKQSNDKQLVGDDQCVPVVLQSSKTQASTIEKPENIFAINSENVSTNNSVEPMDIDETLSENVSLSELTADSKQSRKSSISLKQKVENIFEDSSNQSKRKSLVHSTSQIVEESNTDKVKEKKACKSSVSMSPHVGIITNDISNKSNTKSSLSSSLQVINIKDSVNESIDTNSKGKQSHELGMISIDTPNKAKRKSSLSNSTSLDHDKSPNDNKSTFLLSQIKDMSENSVSKSPQVVNELSKSVDIKNNGKDESVSKNKTLNYLTSTPVQQKHFEKLGVAMNSSITPTWGNNKETNKILKEDLFTKKISVNDSSSEDSDKSNDQESSQDKSNLLDDVAEDAGDDYESGDSQDEDERQYEVENEILHKGETLFEEEISNDSDYEKDSFIASSDEEQNSLLSGTGDDLSSSDNELKMSSKSKQKYNARKLKEQKKASREMYEARHGFKKIHNDKTNKNNRNRLDSTLLKSDEENLPPKKNKRMRFESTFETDPEETYKTKDTALNDEEIGYKKKKSKRLSESLCNENTVNEKEITIFNEEVNDKEDPLTINVKQELKTPQKDFEISTIQINDELEQMLIDEDISMMKANDSVDPLQATMVQDENYSNDDDSVSENEEITNNYDYVLEELNKESKKLIKSRDSSLNLNKKLKQKKAAIVAELNLAQTKVSKKDETKQAKEKTITRVFKKLADNDDASSDSINLKMLFSDESDGSKEKQNLEKEEVTEEEYFIPLKRTEAKTDIRKSVGTNETSANESSLNRGSYKNNQKSKSKCFKIKNADDFNADADGVVSFFIDTAGDLAKKGSNSIGAGNSKSDDDDPPIEIFYTSKKNKKQSQKASESEDNTKDPPADIAQTKTPGSKKKKKKGNTDLGSPLPKTPVSEKKKKIRAEHEDDMIAECEEQMSKTPKKKKKISKQEEIVIVTENNDAEITKKRKRLSASQSSADILSEGAGKSKSDDDDPPIEIFYTSKKNKKQSQKASESEDNTKDPPADIAQTKTPGSKKKKKKGNTDLGSPLPKTPVSEKKKKIRAEHEDDMIAECEEQMSKTPKKKKKISKQEEIVIVTENNDAEITKKRKRLSASQSSADILSEGTLNTSPDSNNPVLSNIRKKMKRSDSTEDLSPEQSSCQLVQINSKTRTKRSNVDKESTVHESGFEIKAKNKRKHEDDNKRDKQYKILKEHSFDEIHVPRLPSSIIDQLEEKPYQKIQKKKSKTVSTTDFAVEKIKKTNTKPSNFLEETICLNNDDVNAKKKKKHTFNRPKVLPFLPTVSTSDIGFTTKFQVEVIPQKMEFVGQRDQVSNFRNQYLDNKRLKKVHSQVYNKHRNMKLSKY